MHLDNDLVELLSKISNGHLTEAQIIQIFVRLVLELQTTRQVVRVTKKLDPQAFDGQLGLGPDSHAQFITTAQQAAYKAGMGALTPSAADKWFSTQTTANSTNSHKVFDSQEK